MTKFFLYNLAGILAGILFIYTFYNKNRPDGDPNYSVLLIIAPASILVVIQLIVWWSIAFSAKRNQ